MTFKSIDSQLGDAEKRFFGVGYTRVRHSFALQSADDQGADYIASVFYPTNWSLKGGSEQAAHLASVDAIAVAVSLSEDYLSRGPVQCWRRIANFWIHSCKLIPGARPVIQLERMIARLDVEAPSELKPYWYVTCRLDAFTVVLQLVEDSTSQGRSCATSSESYFGGAFRSTDRKLEAVMQNENIFDARAIVSVDPTQPAQGIESAFGNPPSIIDAAIFCAQVGQVALYSVDRVDRDASDALWLRRAYFTREGPPTSGVDPLLCSVEITKTRLVERNSVRWRTADLIGSFNGISVTFQLAHTLTPNTFPLGVA